MVAADLTIFIKILFNEDLIGMLWISMIAGYIEQ